MSKDPDTARRERAEKLTEQVASLLHELWSKWFLHQYQNATNENVRRWMAQAGTTYWGLSESDKDKDRKLAQPLVEMILAGSREEAEIRSEEVERLESVARGLKQCCEEYRAEIAALTEQTYRLGEKWMEEQSARASERDESRAEIAALRDVVSLQGSALREIRIRLHAAGRRPEECYEMSILDDTIAAVRRALEAAK